MEEKIKKDIMREYELLVLLSAQLPEEEIQNTLETIRAEIAKRGGAVTKDQLLWRRKLAYPIKQTVTGVYHIFVFNSPSREAKAMDKTLRLHQNVLRHHLTIYSPKKHVYRPAPRLRAEITRPAPIIETAPIQEAAPTPLQKLTSDELDKKLDQILEETEKNL